VGECRQVIGRGGAGILGAIFIVGCAETAKNKTFICEAQNK